MVWGQFQKEVEQSPESFVWPQTGCSVVGSLEVVPQPQQVLRRVPLDLESQSYSETESHSQQMPAKGFDIRKSARWETKLKCLTE